MTIFGRLTACLTMALLVLTGQQISMAKASGPGVMQAVICSGGGLITVTLDADGNPTGPAHVCPDAMLAFVPGVALPTPAPRRITIRAAQATAHATTMAPAALRLLPPPRGPPLSV